MWWADSHTTRRTANYSVDIGGTHVKGMPVRPHHFRYQ